MHLLPPAKRRILPAIVARYGPLGTEKICYPGNFARNQSNSPTPQFAAGAATATLSPPPATIYGTLRANAGMTARPGMLITARVGDTPCGEARTHDVDGAVVFAVDVPAAGPGPLASCGVPGRPLWIELEGRVLPGELLWDNSRPQELR